MNFVRRNGMDGLLGKPHDVFLVYHKWRRNNARE